MKLFNTLLAQLIMLIRPFFGPAVCFFEISCGNYALQALKKYSFPLAVYSIIKRLLACGPLHRFISTTGLHSLE